MKKIILWIGILNITFGIFSIITGIVQHNFDAIVGLLQITIGLLYLIYYSIFLKD